MNSVIFRYNKNSRRSDACSADGKEVCDKTPLKGVLRVERLPTRSRTVVVVLVVVPIPVELRTLVEPVQIRDIVAVAPVHGSACCLTPSGITAASTSSAGSRLYFIPRRSSQGSDKEYLVRSRAPAGTKTGRAPAMALSRISRTVPAGAVHDSTLRCSISKRRCTRESTPPGRRVKKQKG